MRRLTLLLIAVLCLCLTIPAAAQQEDFTPEQVSPGVFRIQVFVDSAFAHVAPAPSALITASVFENDILEAVGRNADGTWFEVRRPGRSYKLGWVSDEFVSKDFDIELLPLTDAVTGVNGTAIVDSGYGVFVQQESVLRDGPLGGSQRIGIVPYGVTVPALGRNRDASRIQVNYLGQVGWISGFNIRRTAFDAMLIPEAPGLPPLQTLVTEIIPPEIQLAQIQEVRDYITPKLAIAHSLGVFWEGVAQGNILPCNPPSEVANYTYDSQDMREMPELGRLVPRLEDGVDSLNSSIGVLQNCGILDADDVLGARNAAINAELIFSSGLWQLDSIEAVVLRGREYLATPHPDSGN